MIHKVALLTDFSKEEKESAFKSLSLSQQAYIKNKPPLKAEQSICARILLSRLLKEETGKDILRLIGFDENKRPFIFSEPNLNISITHSDGLVAAASSLKPIGIDVEKIRPISTRLTEALLNTLELDFLKNKDSLAFFKIWTAREALIKTGAYSYSQAKKVCFVNKDKILAPDRFKLEQYVCQDYLISIIEQEK